MDNSSSQGKLIAEVLNAAVSALTWRRKHERWRERAERLYRRIQFGEPYFQPGTVPAIWVTLAFLIIPVFLWRKAEILLATLPMSLFVYLFTWAGVRLYLRHTRRAGPWEQPNRPAR